MEHNWKKKFVVIYAGQAFSLLGSAAVQFAVIWWLTVQKEPAITRTLATVVSFLPNILFRPFAGVWIDRYNRRTVMIAADGLVVADPISEAVGVSQWFMGSGLPMCVTGSVCFGTTWRYDVKTENVWMFYFPFMVQLLTPLQQKAFREKSFYSTEPKRRARNACPPFWLRPCWRSTLRQF